MPKLKIGDLNKMYSEAETADRDVFAEFRSNILLISGEHYSKRRAGTTNRIRSSKNTHEYQKLRLTKNHTHRVHRSYVSNILQHSPGVTIGPQMENELQDQKAAELNLAVWQDAKTKYRLKEKVRQWCHSFVGIGEVALKLFWDPNKGEFQGYRQKVDEDGEPMFDMEQLDEQGQPQPLPDEDQPVFKGEFCFEEVYAFNLLRKVQAGSMRDSECWIVRKMTDTAGLKAKYKDDDSKKKMIEESSREDFVVFDQDKSGYQRTKGQTLVREFYFRPGYEYPDGYFYVATKEGILEEGPLPFGVWPLRWQGMDELPTAARAKSIHRVVRPYQAEVNRASSAQAQTQITIGDDKVLYQAGSKLQQGSLLPGVRGIAYQGATPTILPGRDGSQYSPYINDQIIEMDRAVMLDEDGQTKQPQSTDNYALLFRSLKQQKRFSEYGEKFEQFLSDVCELYLTLARHYLPDDELIYAVGTKEAVNIEEFKSTVPLHYQIKLEPQDETIETKFGKQLALNHTLQYVGASLDQDTIGKVLQNMPFANSKDIFSQLTIDEDNVKNDMLAMERGQQPKFDPEAKNEFYIARLTHRIKQPDFDLLPQEVQQMYYQYRQMHQMAFAEKAAKEQAAKDGFVPVSGAMIATDMYVPNPKGPDKPAKRVRIPYQALDWLVKRLESQGATIEKMENMNKGQMAEVADMLLGQARGLPANQESSAFQNAPESAVGVS